MQKMILATLAAAALAAPAYAADMPAKVAPVVTAASPWSGFYFGAIGAGAKTAGDVQSILDIPGQGNLRPSGLMAGGLVGIGGWVGNLFVGLEADASYDFSKADQLCAFGAVATDCQMKSGWFLTQRAVIGAQMGSLTGAARRVAPSSVTQWRDRLNLPSTFATSTVMPYVTGGIAERRIEACVAGACGKEWIAGPAFGGGIRVPVSSGVSVGVEYLYVKYDKHFATSPIFPAEFKAVSEHLARVSLTGHF